MSQTEERFAYNVDWYDAAATIVRKYILLFFPKDNAVEMFDIKNHRPFLKRTKCEGLRVTDLHIGNTVNILSRQLKITDFGDEFTRKMLQSTTEKTLAIVKPHAIPHIAEIIQHIERNRFVIVNLKMFKLNRAQAVELYEPFRGQPFLENLLNLMTSGPVIAMELMRDNAISGFRDLIGPSDPIVAKQQAPGSLRAKFGVDTIRNAVHGADTMETAIRESKFFFPSNGCSLPNTATFKNTTCAVVKPHIVTGGKLGDILQSISSGGFEINALRMYSLDKANAEEFLEVYKGVIAEYSAILLELISGPCVALEIALGPRLKSDYTTQKVFRDFVGPMDPEMARHLRPNTLRAIYGQDKICNGIHCTDLPDDADLEVQYFFEILDK